MKDFQNEVADRISRMGADKELHGAAAAFMVASMQAKYSYNFAWLGRPIIQYPQDIVAMQELVWHVRPDLIIETGIAHGGSIVLSASMLAMLDLCDAVRNGTVMDPRQSRRKVVGLDIDIRPHNRAAVEDHPMAHWIEMIQGSSIAPDIVRQVRAIAAGYSRVLVCLDSNHTHDHVLAELEAYAPLVTADSYCVVFDTIVEDMPPDMFLGRGWGRGNNPKTAVWHYLQTHSEFAVDESIQAKLSVTVAPDGYLRRLR